MVAKRCEYTAAMCWALAVALAATGWLFTVSFFGVGVVVAAPLLLWLGRRGDIGRAFHGVILGTAAVPLWIAWLNRDYQPCPAPAADVADGSWHCGGTDPVAYLLVAGAVVVAFAVVWVLSRSER